MSKDRYERSLRVGATRRLDGYICPHTGEGFVPVQCTCEHGEHRVHWVRKQSAPVTTNPFAAIRKLVGR
jgi:uncharacterized OB-fold protein